MSHIAKNLHFASAKGVPIESLDSHASKSLYDFSADSGAGDIRTEARTIDKVGPPNPIDRDDPLSLEMEVNVRRCTHILPKDAHSMGGNIHALSKVCVPYVS